MYLSHTDPGEIGVVDSGPVFESPIQKAAGDVGSELVGLHVKGLISGESLPVSKKWLPLGGTVGKATTCQNIKYRN